MEKISVIVPVYKVEPYLRRCIDSILGQTHRNFELILVDDGSPDNCGTICDEYAAKDDRITVIHQENGGLSAARNAGLDWVFANSDSRWLTFVDSDDALAPIMLETLYNEAVKYQADIVQTNYECFCDEAELVHAGEYIGPTSCVTGKTLVEAYYRSEDILSIAAWGKLIRRELYQNLRFPVGKINEDQAITPILFYGVEKVALNRSWLYFYRVREGSIMHSAFSPKRFDDVDAVASCAAYFEENGDPDLAKSAKRYGKVLWARMLWTARQEGVYDQVPAQYRMRLIRALGIVLADSLHRGGVRFVALRIRNLMKQLKR